MGNHLTKNSTDSSLIDNDTLLGKEIRRIAMNQNDYNEWYNKTYKYHQKRACCMGVMNKKDETAPKYIMYPLMFYNTDDINENCILNYTKEENIDGNSKIIKYKDDTGTLRFSEVINTETGDYDYYSYYDTGDDDKSLIYSKKSSDNKIIVSADLTGSGLLEKLYSIEVMEDGPPIYRDKNDNKISYSAMMMLDNRVIRLNLNQCLARKDVKLDLYVPDDKTPENYCNSNPDLILKDGATTFDPINGESNDTRAPETSECPAFMRYNCAKVMNKQGCTYTDVSADGRKRRLFNHGNPFCVSYNAQKGNYFNPQLKECACNNSFYGPTLNNDYNPKFWENNEQLNKLKEFDTYNLIGNKSTSQVNSSLLTSDKGSLYSLNVNNIEPSSQKPWKKDATCQANSYYSNETLQAYIENEGRGQKTTIDCSIDVRLSDNDIGGNVNMAGNQFVNVCGGADPKESASAFKNAIAETDDTAPPANKDIQEKHDEAVNINNAINNNDANIKNEYEEIDRLIEDNKNDPSDDVIDNIDNKVREIEDKIRQSKDDNEKIKELQKDGVDVVPQDSKISEMEQKLNDIKNKQSELEILRDAKKQAENNVDKSSDVADKASDVADKASDVASKAVDNAIKVVDNNIFGMEENTFYLLSGFFIFLIVVVILLMMIPNNNN